MSSVVRSTTGITITASARQPASAEKPVLAAVPSAVVLRPSILFGPEDSFFNRFASIARFSPALPLIGGGHTLFQPIFAGDVAQAVVAAIEGGAQEGAVYELGGPQVRSFKDLMRFLLATIERRRLLIPIPFVLAKAQASLLQLLPRPLLTKDQVEHLRRDNVVSEQGRRAGRTLAALGIDPVAMASVLPSYLWRFRKAGEFTKQTTEDAGQTTDG
jgi:NADH dehydrogenase